MGTRAPPASRCKGAAGRRPKGGAPYQMKTHERLQVVPVCHSAVYVVNHVPGSPRHRPPTGLFYSLTTSPCTSSQLTAKMPSAGSWDASATTTKAQIVYIRR